MKAFDFEYAGRTLSSFDMILCNFGDKGLDTVSNGATITFNTISTLNGAHYKLSSTTYEDCLETTMQICRNPCKGSNMEISSTTFRELTKWLCRKHFLKLKFLSEEYIDLYYEAIINVSRIELDGKLVGLELEVKTNRPFALKEPRTIVVQSKYLYAWEKFYVTEESTKGASTGKYVTSYDRNAYPDNDVLGSYFYVYVDEKKKFDNKHSIHDTSHEEGYIYPYTEIVIDEEGDLDIYNALEDRHTVIKGCKTGEVITMDYPVIQSVIPSSGSSHNIQNDFNWTFFRIANTYDNSRNDLTISLPCSLKIKYSPIVKVGI